MKCIPCLILAMLIPTMAWSQDQTYENKKPYRVKSYTYAPKDGVSRVKNIILLIGDGMGMTQIYSGMTANRGQLFLENCRHIGMIKTYASDNYITDSAAGATAFSAGEKTYNGAIGVDDHKQPLKTILEMAEDRGLATGLVATSKITHATPAAFIAHQPSRGMYEEIAADFLKTDVDVFIGGGKKEFTTREDGRDLTAELESNGYQMVYHTRELTKIKSGKVAGLLNEGHMPNVSGINGGAGRGDMLMKSANTALRVLNQDPDGFFLMIEGSQIDWGGHSNLTWYITEEMMDFDQVIGRVLEFAEKDGETLVIITADHETGGFALNGGDLEKGSVTGAFTTDQHTSVMVPVFAFGPAAEEFIGIYENTAIFDKMVEALKLK